MSDVNSKNSLPIPVITTISPELANSLAKYELDMANVLNVGKQAAVAEAINLIISMIHRLTYNPEVDGDDERLFQVRTRRIITTSMSIAVGSNLILTTAGAALQGILIVRTPFLNCAEICDLFYIIDKKFPADEKKKLLQLLLSRNEIISESKEDILCFIENKNWTDLEDGL